MNEILILLRKDLRLLLSESYLPIIIVAIVVLSGVAAFSAVDDYSTFVRDPPMDLSLEDKELKQRTCLLDFWNMVIPFDVLIVLAVSALSLSMERENGMLRFILSYGRSRSLFFASKGLVVIMICTIAALIPVAAFPLGFFITGIDILIDAQLMLASAVFPLLIVLSASMLGLLISALCRKRHTAVIVAVMAFLVITMTYSSTLQSGMDDAMFQYRQEHGDLFMTISDARELFPEDKRVALLLNPMLIKEGLPQTLNLTGNGMNLANVDTFAFYDQATDATIGLATIGALFLAGYLLFMHTRRW